MRDCKNCKSEKIVKSGKVRGKQRYKCKECGYNFVDGDGRTNEKIAALKALCVLLYSPGKGSYNMMGKLFGRNRSLDTAYTRTLNHCKIQHATTAPLNADVVFA